MRQENRQIVFEQLFIEYRDKVYRLCYSYTRNQTLSEDLVQECFSKAWQHFPDFENRSDIGTWIYRIAANTCLMHLRKSTKSILEYKEIVQSSILEETNDEIEERSSVLFNAINQLEEMDRLIISMVLEDIPQKQIGEVLGINENNVNIKVYRIKKKLKELIVKNK